jgi:stearoyl-CoA desaturase (delta-9 desaturase)
MTDHKPTHEIIEPAKEQMMFAKSIPFFAMHLVPFLAFFTGVRVIDWVVCIALYYVRMFFITGGYHRYFAHRSYNTSRFFQFVLAFGGGTSAQKGALWWAAHHRHHHRYSDTEKDIHSPLKGFWWSHVGWILVKRYDDTDYEAIKDLAKYPELVWLNKYHYVPPILLGVAVFLAGGWSMLLIGFFLSTVILYHGTFFINSLSHVFGRRRYVTKDTSRNSMLLALVTLGEGWHNNHHYYQAAARQGFFWWEIDGSYYVLKVLSWLRIVSDLRQPPKTILHRNRLKDGLFDIGMFHAYWQKSAEALLTARKQSAEVVEAKKVALGEFLDSAKQMAGQIARLSKQEQETL